VAAAALAVKHHHVAPDQPVQLPPAHAGIFISLFLLLRFLHCLLLLVGTCAELLQLCRMLAT
jgi:hypothetical protein